MDKLFERLYSIDLPKLKLGEHQFSWEIKDEFFEHFEHSQVTNAEITIEGKVTKYGTHVDGVFLMKGSLKLPCDRCTELYDHPVDTERRVIFGYDERLAKENDDVILIDKDTTLIDLSGEFYDFIHLEVPIRRVPPIEIHECPESVIELLNKKEENKEEEIDPRWEALRELKNKK